MKPAVKDSAKPIQATKVKKEELSDKRVKKGNVTADSLQSCVAFPVVRTPREAEPRLSWDVWESLKGFLGLYFTQHGKSLGTCSGPGAPNSPAPPVAVDSGARPTGCS